MTKAIKRIALVQALLLVLLPVSSAWFVNVEIAFLSSFFILLGSMYSYARLVRKRVENYESMDEKDMLDKIDDPYDLYDDEHADKPGAVDPEEVDLKALIKEEKARIRASGTAKNAAKGAPALVSLYRLIPYAFLVLGFIGLKNNGLLELWPYLAGIGLGILAGLFVGKDMFAKPSAEA